MAHTYLVCHQWSQDLERTWEQPIDGAREDTAQQQSTNQRLKALDYLLLDTLQPLRPILSSFGITLDLATRFEAHCRSKARQRR